MVPLIPISIIICIIALIIGSFTDIKTREVPDWLNYSLIFTGLSIHLIYSIIFWDFSFIIKSFLGFLTFFIMGNLMYYSGQWGGGDSKMIMGLGALIGLELNINNFILGF
ncbi:prepilin peptidase, partial [Candidatus Woesearchaeota archaeon]|nr:prepilin peptidase [Candidatus Woesearchaeota archaeon]